MTKKRTYKQSAADARKRFKTETLMRRFLIRDNPMTFIEPIESHIVRGIPDLFFRQESTNLTGWAELKEISRKVRNSFSPSWRPGQIAWARRYQKTDGFWMLIISINDILYYSLEAKDKYIMEEMHLFKGFGFL